ncbi:MAG: sensor histidine kinase [Nitriliruptoraceae bacterium]
MSSLDALAERRAGLHGPELDALNELVADWQILADLAFSDLLLFARDADEDTLIVIAQIRPHTAPTIYQEDLVGAILAPAERPLVTRAFDEGLIVRDGEPDLSTGVPVREEAIPVPVDGRVIAVVSREANLSTVRPPSQLELSYLRAADELARMLCHGEFPLPGQASDHELGPRVGDGMMRLDAAGTVIYASPNAMSAYRRLGVTGAVMGRNIEEFDLDDAALLEALALGEPLESEVEAGGTIVLRRLLPLTRQHQVLGGLVLVREVTELRRHERLLLYKDATIREIHHRVKNNLQTVASLLRLQSRRLASPDARDALAESVRRISSIALVHETLSQDAGQRVVFDKVAHRLIDMVATGLTDPDRPVRMRLEGSAGDLPAEVATPLALVLSELLQNALEHGFVEHGGEVVVQLDRRSSALHLAVSDDGVGVPEGWDVVADANLGLQIAMTLVESELGGTLEVERIGPQGGTRALALLPIPGRVPPP